jgi:flagellar basal body-associated protein FliL
MSTGTSGNPPGTDDSVVAAYSAGQAVPEIADQHRISRDAVYEIVHRVTTAPARFCSACGTALPTDAGFCPQCGNPTAAVAKPAAERPAALWAVLAAGMVAVLGSFLPWVTVTAPIIGTISKSGIDGSDGWASVALGALLAAYAAVRLRPMRLPGAVTALAGLVAALLVGLAVVEFVDLRSKAAEAKSTMTGQEDPFGMGAAFSAATRFTPGTGLWLVFAAGLIGGSALLITAVSNKMIGGAAAAVVLVAGSVTAAVITTQDQGSATGPGAVTAAKGAIGTIDEPLTISLAGDHYVKLAFAVQFTADVTTPPDLGAAITAAVDIYTGHPIDTLDSEDGRAQLKSDFLARLRQAYPGTVLDVYFTQLVTQ